MNHHPRLSSPWRTLLLVHLWLPLQPIRFVPAGTSSIAVYRTVGPVEAVSTTAKIITDDFTATYKESGVVALLSVVDAIGG